MKKRLPVTVNLGNRIRALRKGQDLTQVELAERARMHEKFLSDVEVGNRDVRLSTLVKLAKGLKVELLDLLRFSEEDEMMREIEKLLSGRDAIVRGHLLRMIREGLLMLDSSRQGG
jgi:transcriptional regulator with XRE-family HTH domain